MRRTVRTVRPPTRMRAVTVQRSAHFTRAVAFPRRPRRGSFTTGLRVAVTVIGRVAVPAPPR